MVTLLPGTDRVRPVSDDDLSSRHHPESDDPHRRRPDIKLYICTTDAAPKPYHKHHQKFTETNTTLVQAIGAKQISIDSSTNSNDQNAACNEGEQCGERGNRALYALGGNSY